MCVFAAYFECIKWRIYVKIKPDAEMQNWLILRLQKSPRMKHLWGHRIITCVRDGDRPLARSYNMASMVRSFEPSWQQLPQRIPTNLTSTNNDDINPADS